MIMGAGALNFKVGLQKGLRSAPPQAVDGGVK